MKLAIPLIILIGIAFAVSLRMTPAPVSPIITSVDSGVWSPAHFFLSSDPPTEAETAEVKAAFVSARNDAFEAAKQRFTTSRWLRYCGYAFSLLAMCASVLIAVLTGRRGMTPEQLQGKKSDELSRADARLRRRIFVLSAVMAGLTAFTERSATWSGEFRQRGTELHAALKEADLKVTSSVKLSEVNDAASTLRRAIDSD